MSFYRSKVTSQGRVLIPIEVRKKLGIGPGSVLEWEEQDGKLIVRRSGTFSSEDIHREVFPDGVPEPRSLDDLREGIEQYMQQNYAHR